MIPKIIHYCWFGGRPLPKSARKCIASWKKYCPDYDIVEWNERNFDVNINQYTQSCYKNKQWAFLSDYVRLFVVYQHGGFYFDTDVEVIRSIDELRNNESFWGFENNQYVASGLGFGAVSKNRVVEMMIQEYMVLYSERKEPVNCPKLNTAALVKLGLKQNGQFQKLECATVYPKDYFNPMNSLTGQITISSNTYTIHRYTMSALSKRKKIRTRITRIFRRFFGVDFFRKK